MAKDILRRSEAPITDEAWALIDEEAVRVLKGHLSARSLVDFDGPYGWEKDTVNVGTLELGSGAAKDAVKWGTRRVLPLVEARVPFSLDQMELDSVSRGAKTPNLDAVSDAARKLAIFEETAIYKGQKGLAMDSLTGASEHAKIALGKKVEEIDDSVAKAIETLQLSGVNGPYSLALGSKAYHAVARARFQSGQSLISALQERIRGEIVWTPAIDGGVLVSTRGGDFELTVGQDLSIGYCRHDSDAVEFYIAESFAFRVLEPRAVVVFSPSK